MKNIYIMHTGLTLNSVNIATRNLYSFTYGCKLIASLSQASSGSYARTQHHNSYIGTITVHKLHNMHMW